MPTPENYELPENDHLVLLQACGLKQHDEKTGEITVIPAAVRDAYYRFRVCHDRISASPFPTYILAWIALSAGQGEPTKAEVEQGESFLALYDRKAVKYGDKIEVEWRGKKKPAQFQGVKADRSVIYAQIDGQSEVREFSPNDAFLLKPETAGASS